MHEACALQVIFEHIGGKIAEVLDGQRGEELRAVGTVARKEAVDLGCVGKGVLVVGEAAVSGMAVLARELAGGIHKAGDALDAHLIGGVLLLTTAYDLLGRERAGGSRVVGGRVYVELVPGGTGGDVHGVQRKFHVVGIDGAEDGVAHGGIGRSDRTERALADHDLGLTVLIGDQMGDIAPGGGVDERQAHVGVAYRGAGLVAHRDSERDGGAVGGGLVDDHLAALAGQRGVIALEVASVVGEQARVHEHRAAGGGGEPATVQLLLGLAGAQVVPCAVNVGLDPGVVVVAVRPQRGVHLACGDTVGAQCGDQVGRLLAAAAVARRQHAERPQGALVGGLVGRRLAAPVVGLEHGVVGVLAGKALGQGVAEDGPGVGERLVVHARRGHKVDEHVLGHVAAPRALGTQPRRLAGDGRERLEVGVEHVGQGHRAQVALHECGNVGVVDGGKATLDTVGQRRQQLGAGSELLVREGAELIGEQGH